jgi:hypothetical protein
MKKTILALSLFLSIPAAQAVTCTYKCDLRYVEVYSRISGHANQSEIEALRYECQKMGWTWALAGGYGYDVVWTCHQYQSESFTSEGRGATIPEAAKVAHQSCLDDGKSFLAARQTLEPGSVRPSNLDCR